MNVGLDILTPNSSMAHHLLSIAGAYGTEMAVMRMLPLLTAILQGKKLIQETTKILRGSEQVGAAIRELCTQLLNKLIKLSRNMKDRGRCESCRYRDLLPYLC